MPGKSGWTDMYKNQEQSKAPVLSSVSFLGVEAVGPEVGFETEGGSWDGQVSCSFLGKGKHFSKKALLWAEVEEFYKAS